MKTKGKNKDRNNLIIAIVAVVSIIALIGGSTFAYYQWISDPANRTNVIFSIKNETLMRQDLYANLEGNGTTTATSLKPATCTHSTHAIKKTVTIKYKNATTQKAIVTATLKTTAFNIRSTSYIPTSTDLGYLKYALTTNSSSCTSNIVTNLNNAQMTGNFVGVAFNNNTTASNMPLTLFDVSFEVPANMTAEDTQTYYLWIWLDSGYSHTNTGSVNSDPMQGITFTTQWSGDITQSA